MYKLVVLFAAVAAASAAPSTLVAPAVTAYGYGAPAVHTYGASALHTYATPAEHTYAVADVPATYAYAAAAPVVAAPAVAVESKVVESPTVVETRTSLGYAQGSALSKQVHYAPQPVVTGYSSSIIKPDLGALATPLHSVVQQHVLAPSRAVHTITPQVTHVQPELHVKKVAVDVPVETPYVSEVEVHTPQIVAKTAPVIATPAVTNYVAAAPYAAAPYAAAPYAAAPYAAAYPALSGYGLAHGYAHGYAAPAVHSLGYSTYAAGVPALYKY